MLTLKRTNSNDPGFHSLVDELNRYLEVQYGKLQEYYSQFNKIDNIPHVVLACWNKQPVGCGCFKGFDTGSVEIKRMFVTPGQRGRGIGASIVKELENWAAELGNHAVVLEHGDNQPEASALYQRLGYTVIPNYGQYAGMETSICRKKELV